jgi:hypothetical protein
LVKLKSGYILVKLKKLAKNWLKQNLVKLWLTLVKPQNGCTLVKLKKLVNLGFKKKIVSILVKF